MITIIATAVSPFLLYMGGITTFLNAALGIFNTPVLVILLCGIFWKKTPTKAAKIMIPIHIVLYILLNYVLRDRIPVLQNIHYLYYTFALFLLDMLLMWIITKAAPRKTDFVHDSAAAVVDLTPWKYRRVMIAVIVGLTAVFLRRILSVVPRQERPDNMGALSGRAGSGHGSERHRRAELKIFDHIRRKCYGSQGCYYDQP